MQLTASDPQYAFAPIMGGPPQRFEGGGTVTASPDWRPGGSSPAAFGGLGMGLRGLIQQLAAKNAFGGEPRYDYDPADQSYTLVSGNPQMASGGLAAAQQTQNRGRGEDTMLVHMTPGEVKGLQALALAHGGSLTINPQTGLPEAGFLKALLPTLLGAGLAIATGGTSLALTPLQIGLGVGALGTLATGSLKKGLMYGLGAWGGAGIGAGLAGAGSAGAQVAGEQAVQNQLQSQATQEAILKEATSKGIADTEIAREMASGWKPEALSTVEGTRQAGVANFLEKPWYQQAGQSIQAIPNQPISQTVEQLGGGKSLAAAAAAPVAEALKPETTAGTKPISYYRPFEFAWNPNTSAYEPSPTPGDTSERRYFTPTFTPMPVQKMSDYLASQKTTTAAGGGLMDLAAGGTPGAQALFTESPKESQFDDERGVDSYAAGGYKRPKSRALTGEDPYSFQTSRESLSAATERNFAAGGLGAARQALAPRFLSGGGDGMSDSIKANIDGKQEARLADGEFVVPADVVSHLGNGSSKAGAKKLYAMMDKIRQARTGKKAQAPAVNAARYMPA